MEGGEQGGESTVEGGAYSVLSSTVGDFSATDLDQISINRDDRCGKQEIRRSYSASIRASDGNARQPTCYV